MQRGNRSVRMHKICPSHLELVWCSVSLKGYTLGPSNWCLSSIFWQHYEDNGIPTLKVFPYLLLRKAMFWYLKAILTSLLHCMLDLCSATERQADVTDASKYQIAIRPSACARHYVRLDFVVYQTQSFLFVILSVFSPRVAVSFEEWIKIVKRNIW